MKLLEGKTVIITGASRGIGQNIAHKELKEGNRISVGIRDLESLKGIFQKYNISFKEEGRCIVVECKVFHILLTPRCAYMTAKRGICDT